MWKFSTLQEFVAITRPDRFCCYFMACTTFMQVEVAIAVRHIWGKEYTVRFRRLCTLSTMSFLLVETLASYQVWAAGVQQVASDLRAGRILRGQLEGSWSEALTSSNLLSVHLWWDLSSDEILLPIQSSIKKDNRKRWVQAKAWCTRLMLCSLISKWARHKSVTRLRTAVETILLWVWQMLSWRITDDERECHATDNHW